MPTDTLTVPSSPSELGAAMTQDGSAASAATGAGAARRIRGLRCKNCQRPEPLGPSYVCPACFGPLEVAYDYDVIRGLLDRSTIATRPPGIWRYLELLPVDSPPARGLAVGSTPLLPAERLGRAIGIDHLWIKDDTRNPRPRSTTPSPTEPPWCRSTAPTTT